MLERTEAYSIAQKCVQLLKEQFKIDNAYIFGSVIGDGIWHKHSDIDIAVEGLPPKDYIKALVAVDKILPSGLDIDLVPLEDASSNMKDRIKNIKKFHDVLEYDGDIIMSVNKIDRLKWLIESEIMDLQESVNELNEIMKQTSERQLNRFEIVGIGGYLQGFYSGIERIFERIIITFEGELPEGENWHTLLLEQMERENSGIRSAIIDKELALKLLDYLRFRHLFRNIYGTKLEWDRMNHLASGASDILRTLKDQLYDFLKSLDNEKNGG